ncbi:MAG: transcription antitermination factor NusB [Candidatus Parabeggiatoa sp. nov. 1]|nr:MAG: transcription antitermination factor NusB [Gammaproteobacteria bacterium]
MPAKPHFSPKARTAARQRVLQALYQWQLTGQDTQIIESQFLDGKDRLLDEPGMSQTDIPYFNKLLHGISQQVNQLDMAFAPFLDRTPAQVDQIERAILRIGCYELKHCPDIPFKVVINEAVELAKKFGAEHSHKYVNSILDKTARHL